MMSKPTGLKEIREWMVAKYPKLGGIAADELEIWLSGKVPYAYPEMLVRHVEEAQKALQNPNLGDKPLKLLFDAFYQVLPFGTGGRRGSVGYGSNRLNPTTIARTIQGHCD